MKKYKIRITDNAVADMESVYQYISEKLQSPSTALNQYNRIADAIMKLVSLPERYPIFDCEPERNRKIHKLVVDNYLICYVIDDVSVIVTSVLYSASDVHKKLISRMK